MRDAAVQEARHKMQMKYNKEAEEAAEKKKQVSNNWSYVIQSPGILTIHNQFSVNSIKI
jgi:hypothetical protein